MRWSRSTRVSTTLRSGASRCSIVSVVAIAAVRVVNRAGATVDGTSAVARTGVNSAVVMTSGNFAGVMAGENFGSESSSRVILADAILATVSFADAGLRTVSFADAMM